MRITEEQYTHFYQEILGFDFQPYDYQYKVAECLLGGKNIILAVPTGAGKTWASIAPFLFAKYHQNELFPQKMIYSLPLRALCNSIAGDVKTTLAGTSYDNLTSIQTGEYAEDKYFEKDIVFSTIDQTLSNFLCFPLALSQRQANLNAGALIGSYLVFDEFHLLDEQRSMVTTIGMLRTLGKLSRFCVMTATLSDGFMKEAKKALEQNNLDVEIITLENFSQDKKKIGSLKKPATKPSKKKVRIAQGCINGDNIKKYHKDKSIIICNRVETAQRVYTELEDWANQKGINLYCLHSRFFDCDRKTTEELLKARFGKAVKDKATNSILIATQVIEAGMDISCEVMHTEIAPINSILQRAGRCARYSEEYGEVHIYDVLTEDESEKIHKSDFEQLSKGERAEINKLKNIYLPYEESLCKVTLEKLKQERNQLFTEEVTVRLVNEILMEQERLALEAMSTNRYNQTKIKNSWIDCSKSYYRDMIRDIQSINIVLIDAPNVAERYPYSLETVSVFRWSMMKWIKEVCEQVDLEEEWVVGILEEETIIGQDLDEQDIPLRFREIRDSNTLGEVYETLFLNKKYFFYDVHIGLNRYQGRLASGFKERKEKEEEIFAYQKDTFIQHTKALLGAFKEEFLAKMAFPFKIFSAVFPIPFDFRRLIELVLLLHDYGKLNTPWQKWMQGYQEKLAAIPNTPFTFEPDIALGHSGFNDQSEKVLLTELELSMDEAIQQTTKQCGKRPGHSGIGAVAILDALDSLIADNDIYEAVAIPASIAIARHHGISNSVSCAYTITDHNYQFMVKLLNDNGLENIKLKQRGDEEDLEVMSSDSPKEFLLYLFLVRILRLCDQKATKDFRKYTLE